jgi:hypothetical protein
MPGLLLEAWVTQAKRAFCCSAVGALAGSGLMLDERALRSVAPAIDQLNSVFNEVPPASAALAAPALLAGCRKPPCSMPALLVSCPCLQCHVPACMHGPSSGAYSVHAATASIA